MVAIRPQAVKGTNGQKFVVTRRFSGDGYEFKIGDVIIARPEWVHKVPQFVDQRFISPFLSEDDEAKVPVNLELPTEAKPARTAEATKAGSGVKVEAPVVEGDPREPSADGEPPGDSTVDESEIDELAASLLQ